MGNQLNNVHSFFKEKSLGLGLFFSKIWVSALGIMIW